MPQENTFMKVLMKKRVSLSKTIQPKVSECLMNNNSLNTKSKHTNPMQSDSDVWWSSDDERKLPK